MERVVFLSSKNILQKREDSIQVSQRTTSIRKLNNCLSYLSAGPPGLMWVTVRGLDLLCNGFMPPLIVKPKLISSLTRRSSSTLDIALAPFAAAKNERRWNIVYLFCLIEGEAWGWESGQKESGLFLDKLPFFVVKPVNQMKIKN